MQSKKELENWYSVPDPWEYETTLDDAIRKSNILEALQPYGRFNKALDVGCGEGWLTKDLPADEMHGLELADAARYRIPKGVVPVTEPHGKYDLVVSTGTLYPQYNWRQMLDWIKESASNVILIAGIEGWFVPQLEELGRPVYYRRFPYRELNQEIRVYEKLQ